MKYNITANRLKEAMNDINISSAELSRRVGMGKSSISQYVNGSHMPSNLSAGRLGKVLGVNPAWLMGYDVDKKNDDFGVKVDKYTIYLKKCPELLEVVEVYNKMTPEARESILALMKATIKD